jgi:hypothetical protein
VTVRAPRAIAYLLVFVLGLGAAGLTACGSGGGSSKALIPSADAGALDHDFDAVAQAVDAGNCPAMGQALQGAQNDLDQLPARVSVRLKTRLQEGLRLLGQQAAKECAANRTATETVPTVTTPAPTTATVPAPTTTTTPTTTAPPTTTTPPPADTTSTTGGDTGGVTVG